jgi:hypothetical protein
LGVNLEPIFNKNLFYTTCREVLGIHVVGLLKKVAKFTDVI